MAAGSRARERAVLSWWAIAAHLGQVIGAVVLVVREFVVDPNSPVRTMTLIAPSALLVFAFLVALVTARARRAAVGDEPLLGQTCLLLGWCGIQWGEFFRAASAAQCAVLTAALLVARRRLRRGGAHDAARAALGRAAGNWWWRMRERKPTRWWGSRPVRVGVLNLISALLLLPFALVGEFRRAKAAREHEPADVRGAFRFRAVRSDSLRGCRR